MPQIMASRTASNFLKTVLRTHRGLFTPIPRPYPRLPRTLQPSARRFAHTIPKPPTNNAVDAEASSEAKPRKLLEPHYQLIFTCVPCGARSSHSVSKQGYHKGSVLISCPDCRNRHIISDNLNIFGDRKINVEDLLREKGQLVKRGTLGEDGDVEFWQDGLAESASEGAASPTSGHEEEAAQLREARDPSSQATNPVPSTSGLHGDANARPSVQGINLQQPTPGTRRQFHTGGRRLDQSGSFDMIRNYLNISKPEDTEGAASSSSAKVKKRLLAADLDRIRVSMLLETNDGLAGVPHEKSASDVKKPKEGKPVDSISMSPKSAYRMRSNEEKIYKKIRGKKLDVTHKPATAKAAQQKQQKEDPIEQQNQQNKKTNLKQPPPKSMGGRLIRRIQLGPKFTGIRFEKLDGPRIVARLKTGQVYPFRPPGGELPPDRPQWDRKTPVGDPIYGRGHVRPVTSRYPIRGPDDTEAPFF